MGRIIIALDFDGVLNRLPKPFEVFMRNTKPNDVLMRAKLGLIKRIIINIIARLPIILNGELIDELPRNIYIISGRCIRIEEIENKMKRLGFKNFYFRKTHTIHETTFKIQKCKELNIDVFFEDRLYVIERLNTNGIIGVDIRKWAKQ